MRNAASRLQIPTSTRQSTGHGVAHISKRYGVLSAIGSTTSAICGGMRTNRRRSSALTGPCARYRRRVCRAIPACPRGFFADRSDPRNFQHGIIEQGIKRRPGPIAKCSAPPPRARCSGRTPAPERPQLSACAKHRIMRVAPSSA